MTNPGIVNFGQLLCGSGMVLCALEISPELNSGLLGFALLLLGIFLFFNSVNRNPNVGTLISVTITAEEIRYEDDKEMCMFSRESLSVNGVRRGLFGCGSISLTSGHALLVPIESVEAIREFLHKDEC